MGLRTRTLISICTLCCRQSKRSRNSKFRPGSTLPSLAATPDKSMSRRRGGTNQYHGAAFEFLRNDALDARPYFFKDPESPTQTAPLKSPYRQNQYGFTLSGPVQIPKLFNGRDRLFFMANYEGFRSRTTATQYFTTMTPAMRAGDFSAVPTALQDPLTRVKTPNPNGSGFTVTSSPFPGNQIPANRFNPSSVYLLENFAPPPNLPQTGLPNRNYQYLQKVPIDKDQFTGRIDFNESASSQWFGRYSWTDELTITPGVQLNGTILYTRASQWMLSNTRVALLGEGKRISFWLQLPIQQHQSGVGRSIERE